MMQLLCIPVKDVKDVYIILELQATSPLAKLKIVHSDFPEGGIDYF